MVYLWILFNEQIYLCPPNTAKSIKFVTDCSQLWYKPEASREAGEPDESCNLFTYDMRCADIIFVFVWTESLQTMLWHRRTVQRVVHPLPILTMQHTAQWFSTLHHDAAYCTMIQHTAPWFSTMHHTNSAHCGLYISNIHNSREHVYSALHELSIAHNTHFWYLRTGERHQRTGDPEIKHKIAT